MNDFLDAYPIPYWLESCPQACSMSTQYGHPVGDTEPDVLLEDPLFREQAIRTTSQLIVGERWALSASSGLVGCAPDPASQVDPRGHGVQGPAR